MKRIICMVTAIVLMTVILSACGGETEQAEVEGPPVPILSGPQVTPVTEPESGAADNKSYEATVVNTDNGVNVRSEKSTDSEILETAEAGDVFTVLEKGDEWCKVKLQGGYGYIHSDFLELREVTPAE